MPIGNDGFGKSGGNGDNPFKYDPFQFQRDMREMQMQNDLRAIRDELQTGQRPGGAYRARGPSDIRQVVLILWSSFFGPLAWLFVSMAFDFKGAGLVGAAFVAATIAAWVLYFKRRALQKTTDRAADNRENDSLLEHIKAGQVEVVRAMLQAGADANGAGNIEQGNRTEKCLPLQLAVKTGNHAIADLLIQSGANANLLAAGSSAVFGFSPPLHVAVGACDVEMVELLIKGGSDVNAHKLGKTALHELCYFASRTKEGAVPILGKLIAAKADINAKDDKGKTPLELALDNDCDRPNEWAVADALVSAGAEITPSAKVALARNAAVKKEMGSKAAAKTTTSHAPAIKTKASDLSGKESVYRAIVAVLGNAGINFKDGMDAASLLTSDLRGKVADKIIDDMNSGKISYSGTDRPSYALGLISNTCRKDSRLNGSKFPAMSMKTAALKPSNKSTQGAGSSDPQLKALQALLATKTDPGERAEIQSFIDDLLAKSKSGGSGAKQKTADIGLQIEKSLLGLVGLDPLKKALAYDLTTFVGGSGTTGTCRVFWGAPATGKTEVAQRLAGMRDGFPALQPANSKVIYLSGIDGKLEIRKIVEDTPEGSLILIDEADKCLDASAGMVSAAEATQLHTALLTNLGRKRLYWAFLGSFVARRGKQPLSNTMLEDMLGRELAGRVDFLDWGFPDWTLENLLLAAKAVFTKIGMTYDDESIMLLAQECIATGSGIRGFENILSQIKRTLVLNRAETLHVSPAVARSYLEKLKGKKAA